MKTIYLLYEKEFNQPSTPGYPQNPHHLRHVTTDENVAMAWQNKGTSFFIQPMKDAHMGDITR
jgi:hypothetical protein